MQKILRYFADTHLGNSHRGLSLLAIRHNIDVRNLGKGEFVVFVNKKQTALKMFAPGNIIAHYKTKDDKRIDPRTIITLPQYFNGGVIDYDKALKKVIEKEFKREVKL